MTKANGSKIKIEKGKMQLLDGRGRRSRYPYDQMEVGDSFLIPSNLKPSSVYNVAREGTRRAALKGQTARFSSGKDEDGLMRCWRVE